MIKWFKKIFKKDKLYIDWESSFSISVGELCEDCECELDLVNGGFTGKPTKCPTCKKEILRDTKINQVLNG
jgi:hypothetical protein